MPTSTVWRCQHDKGHLRPPSPTRPSEIEPLSPSLQPYYSSAAGALSQTRLYTDPGQLHGLGFTDRTIRDFKYDIPRPDHLYIDQNGGAHVRAGKRTQRAPDRPRSDARSSSRTTKYNKGRGHTRSGSTIDDLASIAIASSPTYTDRSPTVAYGVNSLANGTRPATSHLNGHLHDSHVYDRPAKRVKSERYPHPEWSRPQERPKTSSSYQSPRIEDAELLLSLSSGFSWGLQQTPNLPASQVHIEPIEPLPQRDAKTAQTIYPPAPVGTGTNASSTQVQLPSPGAAVVVPAVKSLDEKEELPKVESDQSELHQSDVATAAPVGTGADGHISDVNESVSGGITAATGTAEANPAPSEKPWVEIPKPKKQRKIQPEVQEVCATCHKLQIYGGEEGSTTQWIGCEHCKRWHHTVCAGFKDKAEARSVDKFFCKDCEGQHGSTTFVRKSSRARTAIDYAGLNQGVIKPSDDSTVHHYIPLIKDGRIKVQPDDFARVRPELMNAEFWESMDGMKRPFVVPACWNPRFGVPRADDDTDRIGSSAFIETSSEATDASDKPVEHLSAETGSIDAGYEEVVDCDQDYLDMIMPRDLTVRKVSELYGPEQPVPVIDVKSQETKGQFTLNDWADYYELDGDKPIRNVISLEVSNSRLGRLIRRPRVVRDIDLEDYVWDNDTRNATNKRPVQFYCLMSVADSYTDFHIDFGGSSVYYHILKGVKTFFFIPPEDRYLKKYEDWCNSDTQNETWLGDMCNGNVTRVDLHEGDTAFIPAGWIHSVWTPEDSLVVGGNFLTRLDYELQLKVANVEKTTKVSPKFRYPYFQKVMWYSLLKYLEEDPVPAEVLRDFSQDHDYCYLRANPISHEIGELAVAAEPGDAAYSARLYPKSELKGLPALRDYLYRTARIYADLPVPDINKKQSDAVKASIPKGYGDPMQLVKTFAVWCAWKIGNETVPEWVHTDSGLLPELKERERLKPEVFRVPPERMSARKAQQAHPQPSSQLVTPGPAAVVVEIPAPSLAPLQIPSASAIIDDGIMTPAKTSHSSDGEDSASKRSKESSKSTTSSTALRVACDVCRKRRIKCRHKEGDISPVNGPPAEIRPRTYSNVSADAVTAVSTSPTSPTVEPVHPSEAGSTEFGDPSDLALAALAAVHAQNQEPALPQPQIATPNANKKGRSKACEECRKSKRRCVHDEHGRIDPAKAAEPSKPRGSHSSKRPSRSSDEGPYKRTKIGFDLDSESADPFQTTHHATGLDQLYLDAQHAANLDNVIDPALMENETLDTPLDPSAIACVAKAALSQGSGWPQNAHLTAQPSDQDEVADASPARFARLTHGDTEVSTSNGEQEPGLSLDTPVHVSPAQQPGSPVRGTSYSPITVDGHSTDLDDANVVLEDSPSATLKDEPRSRRTSQQTKFQEQPSGSKHHSPSKPRGQPDAKARRASSSTLSAHTNATLSKTRRSSSVTSGAVHAATTALKAPTETEIPDRPTSRGSDADSELDADEKFARELQATENGLRRRPSVRV